MKTPLLTLALMASAACHAQRIPPPALDDSADLPDELVRLSAQPSPEPFIQEIYRELQQVPAPAPFVGAHGAHHIYADPLLTSMHREYAASTRRFAGQLDFNPFCACQNPAGVTLSPVTLTPVDKRHTDASFKVHFTAPATPAPDSQSPTAFPTEAPVETASATQPPSPATERAITLHLIQTSKGWRIDDISSAQVRSFKLMMRDKGQPPVTPQ